MTLRRIRLQSHPPLPALRVWFLIPEGVTDVQSLKAALCTEIPALKKLDTRHTRLVLEMDEFELLDFCAIALVHEDDVITIKLRETDVPVLDNMNHDTQTDKSIRSQKRRRLSSSSEDSTTSSSSSSSDSSSDSSTESHSVTDGPRSHPGYISAGGKSPSNARPRVQPGFKSHVHGDLVSRQPTVPPGLGKPSTHSRNRRRRIKRKFVTTELVQQKMPSNQSIVGREEGVAVSLVSEDVQKPSAESPGQSRLPATEVANVGFRIGKKNSVKRVIGDTTRNTVASDSTANQTSSSIHPPNAPAFIPPSERKDLPKNIFITSVDVEWRTDQQYAPWKDINKVDGHRMESDGGQTTDFKVTQPIDWDEIERKWDKFPKFDTYTSISPDGIVAWKAFGLDPTTLTPQVSMLHLGKVISLDIDNILIQPLTRPGVGPISFGRASVDEDQESTTPISLPIEDVRSNEWRVLIQQ